jgi:GxxExxY protein
LEREFQARGILYRREAELPIYYRGERLNAHYKADFVCFGSMIIELKALKQLSGTEESQILNYLKASGVRKGLLFNFGSAQLEYKRFVFHLRPSVSSAD